MKTNLFTESQLSLFKEVEKMFIGTKVYLVGGAVRDILLGIEPKDYDFCIELNPDEIEEKIKNSNRRAYLTGKRFGTLGCKINGQMIEITSFRGEKYIYGNRKPEIEFVNNITEDLSRRDFTINSMALRLDNLKFIDPFNGKDDLFNKTIRSVGNPKQRFNEDPLRILRCIRFASRFNFKIEEKTYEKLCKCVPNLLTISKERWISELDKILLCDNVIIGLEYLWKTKIFNWIIPELSLQYNYDQNSEHHKFTLSEHTSKVVNSCPKNIDLKWAALLHDIAKPFVRTDKKVEDKEREVFCNGERLPFTKMKSNYIGHELLGAEMAFRIAQHLKFSNQRRERIVDLIKHHLEDSCELRIYDNISKK